MKALSIHPEPALAIIKGQKTEEYRTWQTNYRGNLLICSTAKKTKGGISGQALGIVTLQEINRLADGTYAWQLSELQWIKPFPNKGRLSLYEVADDLVHPLSEKSVANWQTYYEPLIEK